MKIKIYSTDACPYCHMAKDYFRGKSIPFDDINVGKDHAAAKEMIDKSGQMGVPVIDIDGDIVIGFDVPKIEGILNRKSGSGDFGEESTGIAKVAGIEKASDEEVEKAYDMIIIGGSAAGLTAAMFATRREMKALVVTKDIGGQVSEILEVCNYPGMEKVSGPELSKLMEKQALSFGATIKREEAVDVKVKSGPDNREVFFVRTKDGDEFAGRTLILAMGKKPRSLNAKGEDKFLGKGVSYCANCDAPLFRGKTVAVVGGGNAAFDAAILLSKIAKKVYLVHRRESFRAFESAVRHLKAQSNVEFVLNTCVAEIKGDRFVGSIVLKGSVDGDGGGERELAVDGVFVEVGSDVDTGFVKHLVELDKQGQIRTSKSCETSRPGVFAAGDVTDTPFKQIVSAAGDGCKAALAAYNHLHGIESSHVAEWTSRKEK